MIASEIQSVYLELKEKNIDYLEVVNENIYGIKYKDKNKP